MSVLNLSSARQVKVEDFDAIKCIYDGKDVFLWLPTGFGKSICYETAVCFNYKHSDGGTGSGCTVVVVVSPLVSLIMGAIATSATLQAVYLVWLFNYPHNNTCNLSIIGLVWKRFPESFAYVQTVVWVTRLAKLTSLAINYDEALIYNICNQRAK